VDLAKGQVHLFKAHPKLVRARTRLPVVDIDIQAKMKENIKKVK
jgi:hypothetical protein